MPRATVTSKGQITIPKSVRDTLGLATGDVVDFVADRGGGYLVQPLRPRSALQGMCNTMVPRGRHASVEQMQAIVAEVAARRAKGRRVRRRTNRG